MTRGSFRSANAWSDLFCSIDLLVKKPAVADQFVVSAKNDGELRRQHSLVPREKFLQHGLRLLARVWAQREAHEIRVRHQFCQKIDIFLKKRAENEARCFKHHFGRGD